MSGSDRRPHETATTLNQSLLDFCQDNLDNRLQMIVEIERPQEEETRYSCTFSAGSPGEVTAAYNPFSDDDAIIFETTGSLPTELSVGTIYFVKSSDNGVFEVSSTIGGASISFSTSGSGTTATSFFSGLIRVSDRNIFVGGRFYEARTQIPLVRRTIGEWLRPTIEFSSLNIVLNNVDGEYSGMLPGGSNYSGQIDKNIKIKLGLRDVESTYFTIFDGYVTETGGFKRDISAVKYVARDKFDRLNNKFPTDVMSFSEYPKLDDDLAGKAKPLIYGDYTASVPKEGVIPAQILNGRDPQINYDLEVPIDIANGTPGIFTLEDHRFDNDDRIHLATDGTLPSPLATGTDYYVQVLSEDTFSLSSTPGGPQLSTSGGSGQHSIKSIDLVNIRALISVNANTEFQQSEVWLSRSEIFYRIEAADIVNVHANKNYFEIAQNTGNTLIDGNNYTFDSSDVFLVKVKGKDLAGYDNNIVAQSRNILETYTDLTASDFDSNWDTYRNKTTPAQSAIFWIPSRAWIQEKFSALEYSLSMLEQVRLEAFISRDLKLKINSLHLEDFEPSPSHILRNFDVAEGSLNVTIDDRNNFNRAQGFFDFSPFLGESSKTTGIFRNQAAIDQSKEIYRSIEFPNLVNSSDVEYQVTEILRISSASPEILDLDVTARQVLLDIGDFVNVNVAIGSTVYENIPMLIREIGYGSDLKLPIRLWSMQMIPFANPAGWNPVYSGIVGGDSATITEE